MDDVQNYELCGAQSCLINTFEQHRQMRRCGPLSLSVDDQAQGQTKTCGKRVVVSIQCVEVVQCRRCESDACENGICRVREIEVG